MEFTEMRTKFSNVVVCRLKEVAAELEAKEAAEANAKNEETESDDDDVQIISSTFDEEVASKNNQRLDSYLYKSLPTTKFSREGVCAR